MSRSLPDRPDLQHLRRQARRLHAAYADASSDALVRIREAHPRLSGSSDDQLIAAELTLQDCQLVIAREYGFDSWPQLKAHVDGTGDRSQPTHSVDELIEFFAAVQRPVPWTQEEHLRASDVELVRQLLERHPSLAHARIRTEVFSSKEDALREALRAEPQPDPDNKLTITALHPVALGFFRGASPTDLALARLLLEAGADVDAHGDMSQDGPEAPINYAAWEGGFEMVRLLLVHGADVSGDVGWGALKTAAGHGRVDCFDLLIEHGAPVTPELLIRAGLTERVTALVDADPGQLTSVDDGGYTLLQRAAAGTDRWHGDPQAGHRLTSELIERGAEVDICTATALDDTARVEAILRADPKAAQARLPDGATPVHFAAISGSAGTLALLLAGGADPDLGKEEQTPLKLAARLNDTAVCRLLLQHGAAPTDMAIDSAAWHNTDPELIKLLLDHGGSPNPTQGPDDRVAIHWACRANAGAVRYLIDAGANVNTKMSGGSENTPLHEAVGNRDNGPEIIEMLLDAGADPTLANRDGETPLAVAVSEGMAAAAEVLRRRLSEDSDGNGAGSATGPAAEEFFQAVADVDLDRVTQLLDEDPSLVDVDAHGPSPLAPNMEPEHSRRAIHFAAFGRNDLLRLLIERGADVNALGYEGNHGWSPPLVLACWEGTVETVRLLLDAGADPNLPSDPGGSALHAAINHFDPEKIELLLQHGAQHDIYSAAAAGDLEEVKRQLTADEDQLNRRSDLRDRTPVEWAVFFGQTAVAEYLLEVGADASPQVLIGMGRVDEVRKLAEEDPEFVHRPFGGKPPLEHALGRQQLEMVKLLLSLGADPNAGD